MNRLFAIASILSWTTSCALAQQLPLFEMRYKEHITKNERAYEQAIVFDIDGDGDADVVPSYSWPQLNFGRATFLETQLCYLSGRPLVAADFDGDGRRDVLLQQSNVLKVGLNRFPLDYTEIGGDSPLYAAEWVLADDVDGDGDIDVILHDAVAAY
ncbi:MAG: VCBS repeat-containing protein, partial [Planctomycetes bacterium]|nr:VCBS repeat-containing protein [Planctomycetota bacterium]